MPTYLNILAGDMEFAHAGGVDLALGLATFSQTKTPDLLYCRDGTRRLGMPVPSSLKPRTVSPFGVVRGVGGSSGRESLVTLEQRIASSETYVM